jgi:hypothetical protein
VLVAATEPGRGGRVYFGDLEGSKALPVTPENLVGPGNLGPGPVSTDGTRFLMRGPNGLSIFPTTAGPAAAQPIAPVAVKVPGLESGDFPVGWTTDDRAIYVQGRGGPAGRVFKVDLATGRRELWKEILPADAAGVVRISSVLVSPDGSFYAYAYSRVLSNLYLVEGVK